jgi:type IV pilus assembly protein PilY1
VVSTFKQTPGKNYLVGALGPRRQGHLRPRRDHAASFAAANVLWELRDDGGDMGMVINEPQIITLNDATNTKAVMFGNGINSTNGHAVLFIVNLATGAVIKKIDTGCQRRQRAVRPRGRDIDGNGTTDYIYAGDRNGNLWKFDFTGATTGSWAIGAGGQRCTARAPASRSPRASPWRRTPPTAASGCTSVRAATSRSATSTTTRVQTLYGVIDEDRAAHRDAVAGAHHRRHDDGGRPHLPRAGTAGRVAVRQEGWYLDWNNPTAGERIVVRPQLKGSAVVTSTMIPPTASTCEAGGSGFINAVDAFTGTAMDEAFFDMNKDHNFDNLDTITINTPAGPVQVGVSSVSTGASPTKVVFVGNTLFYSKTDGSMGSDQGNPPGAIPSRDVARNPQGLMNHEA